MALTQEQKVTILWLMLFITAVASYVQIRIAEDIPRITHNLIFHSHGSTLTQIRERSPNGEQKQ